MHCLRFQDSTSQVVPASKEDNDKTNGLINQAFTQSKPTLASLEASTLQSDAKLSKFISSRLSDFSPPTRAPTPPPPLERSPIMTLKLSSEPRSITGGTRVWYKWKSICNATICDIDILIMIRAGPPVCQVCKIVEKSVQKCTIDYLGGHKWKRHSISRKILNKSLHQVLRKIERSQCAKQLM